MVFLLIKISVSYKILLISGEFSYQTRQKPHPRTMAVNPSVWLLFWLYFFGKNFGLLTKYVCVEIAFEEFNYLMKLTCLQISSTALSFL